MKPQGDGVVVTFKTESYKSPIYDCKETNKILRINPDGRVEYRQSCVAKGMETIKETTAPVWIRKELADGIKPGTFLIAAVDNKPKPREGYPLEVHADAARKKAVAWWGFALQ